MRQEVNKLIRGAFKNSSALKFIIKSCLTTLLVLGLIAAIWYYPYARVGLASILDKDAIQSAFFMMVSSIILLIVIIQLDARFLRPGRVEKAIERHVNETLHKHSKMGKG